MSKITVLYQQTLQSPSKSSTSESTTGFPIASAQDALGTGYQYASQSIREGAAQTIGGAISLIDFISPIDLGGLICKGSLTNSDMFNNPNLNCSIALAAASLACAGDSGGLIPDDILYCVAPKAVVASVQNSGSANCSVELECACPSDDDNGPLNPDGFNPAEIADSLSDCQLKASKEYLQDAINSQEYQDLKNAAVAAVGASGNAFVGIILTTLFEQINYTVANSGSIGDISNQLNGIVFNTSYVISPARRIKVLLQQLDPNGANNLVSNFENAWNNLQNFVNQKLQDIANTCALSVTISATDVSNLLNSISPGRKKECRSTFVLNEDTCECECPEGKVLCSSINRCIDACPPDQELIVTDRGPFNFASCSCECTDARFPVKLGDLCIPECPGGTTLKEVPCSGEHSWALLDDGSVWSTKCYDCICSSIKGAGNSFPFVTVDSRSAFSCSGEGQIRVKAWDCQCDCDRENGYIRVWDPATRGTSQGANDLNSRCRLPCSATQIYVWDLDSCECPNRLEYETRDPAEPYNPLPLSVRLKTEEEMCDTTNTGKVWNDEFCTCDCPLGFYLYDPLTDTCSCPSGTVLDLEAGACLPPSGSGSGSGCPDGSFVGPDGECIDCPPGSLFIDGLCLPDPSGSGEGPVTWPVGDGSGSGDMPIVYTSLLPDNTVCGQALTCVDGFLYPTTCGPANGDQPISPCRNDLICFQAFTCCDGVLYGNGCCGLDGASPVGPCGPTQPDPEDPENIICAEVITCRDGITYPNGCAGTDGSAPIGECYELF